MTDKRYIIKVGTKEIKLMSMDADRLRPEQTFQRPYFLDLKTQIYYRAEEVFESEAQAFEAARDMLKKRLVQLEVQRIRANKLLGALQAGDVIRKES